MSVRDIKGTAARDGGARQQGKMPVRDGSTRRKGEMAARDCNERWDRDGGREKWHTAGGNKRCCVKVKNNKVASLLYWQRWGFWLVYPLHRGMYTMIFQHYVTWEEQEVSQKSSGSWFTKSSQRDKFGRENNLLMRDGIFDGKVKKRYYSIYNIFLISKNTIWLSYIICVLA